MGTFACVDTIQLCEASCIVKKDSKHNLGDAHSNHEYEVSTPELYKNTVRLMYKRIDKQENTASLKQSNQK